MDAMEKFLEDYPNGGERYIEAELPTLPFEDESFDIALSSHFLLLYSEQLSYEFHIQSMRELCRVAGEARIFPLLELGSRKSRHVDKIIHELKELGYECSIEKVSYEFQKGGNEMLRINSSNKAMHSDARTSRW
jgi:ubiquinone/menaquinone biosynthesis C-methylase UbiE